MIDRPSHSKAAALFAQAAKEQGLSSKSFLDRGTDYFAPQIEGLFDPDLGEVAASAGDDIRRLHSTRVVPAIESPRRHWRFFLDPKGTIQSQLLHFEPLRGLLDGDERSRLDELEQLFRSKLEMDAHATLQLPLRLWLYLHVPTSLLLLGAVGLHLFSVWYY